MTGKPEVEKMADEKKIAQILFEYDQLLYASSQRTYDGYARIISEYIRKEGKTWKNPTSNPGGQMGFNHAQCYNCWRKECEDDTVVRVLNHGPKRCCFCKRWTVEGIFVRKNPREMKCKHD